MINYTVIEGSHKNPNEIKTIDKKSKKEYGPFTQKDDAEALAKSLIQKKLTLILFLLLKMEVIRHI